MQEERTGFGFGEVGDLDLLVGEVPLLGERHQVFFVGLSAVPVESGDHLHVRVGDAEASGDVPGGRPDVDARQLSLDAFSLEDRPPRRASFEPDPESELQFCAGGRRDGGHLEHEQLVVEREGVGRESVQDEVEGQVHLPVERNWVNRANLRAAGTLRARDPKSGSWRPAACGRWCWGSRFGV